MRISILVLGVFAASAAHAKTYFDEASGRALVYYRHGDAVNAAFCKGVAELELRVALRETLHSGRCGPLSKDGLTKDAVAAKLVEIRREAVQTMTTMQDIMRGMTAAMSEIAGSDVKDLMSDKDIQSTLKMPFEVMKSRIAKLTPEEVYGAFERDAADSSLEKTKSPKAFDEEVDQFTAMVSK